MESLINEIFQVRIIWPSGEIIPVIIRKDSTVTDLIFLLQYIRKQQQNVLLFYRGILMNPSKTVYSQVPQENELINVGFVKFQGINNKVDFTQWLRTQTKAEEIYKEALRINDFKLDLLENNPAITLYYKESLDSSMNENIEQHEKSATESQEVTVPPKSENLNKQPLPTFWEKKKETPSEDENNVIVVPYFSSIEEAGDFFSKKRWGDWNW